MEPRDHRDFCAVVVVACHFENPWQLCETTVARLEAAITKTQRGGPPWRYFFIVTGDVPYEPGGKTLAELMQEYLRTRGIRDEILIAKGQTGTFAEPRLVTEMLGEIKKEKPQLNQLMVVSSDWQLQTGEPFWKEYASRAFLQLHPVPVYNTGGWRTRLFYAAYGTFFQIARAIGLWPKLEPLFYRWLYVPRYTKGFRANGCA